MRAQAARYFVYSKTLLVGIMLGALSASCLGIVALGLVAMVGVDRHFRVAGAHGLVWGGGIEVGARVSWSRMPLPAVPWAGAAVDKDCNKHCDARRIALSATGSP